VTREVSTAAMALSEVFCFFQAEDGIRDKLVTGVQTCALPIFDVLLAEAGVLALVVYVESKHAGFRQEDVDLLQTVATQTGLAMRSEERRVGEEGRSRWSPKYWKKRGKGN